MLIIGDAVINNIDSKHKIKTLEFIYYGESQLNYLIDKFDFKKPEYINKFTIRYYREGMIYLLHNAERHKGLKELLIGSFSLDKEFKYIPLIFEFTIRQSRVHKKFQCYKKWTSNLLASLTLKDKLQPLSVSYPDIKGDIEYFSYLINDWVMYQTGIQFDRYIHEKYDVYSKKDLLNSVTNHTYSLYQKINLTINDNKLNEVSFNNFKYSEKIECVLEKLYIDVLNNYILRNDLYSTTTKDDILNLFKRSVMNLITDNTNNSFFKHFIIINYREIVDSFDANFYYIFKNIINNKLINKIKK